MAARTTDVTVTLDPRRVNAMLIDVTNLSARRAADRTRDRARANAGGGRLSKSITSRKVRQTSNQAVYSVGCDLFYAGYQERGTGPIYPVKAKVLRFVSGGVVVFARRTSGVPPKRFMARAYAALSFSDFLP